MSLFDALVPGRDDAAGEADVVSVELGALLDAIANERRRLALRHVGAHPSGVEKGTLVELVAADEFDVPIETLRHGERKAVFATLHQHHLPALESAGLVEWEAAQVRPTPATDAALDVLDHARTVAGGDV